MSKILYFDSFAFVGKRMGSLQNGIYKLNDVASEMERCGINGALLTHTFSRDYDPLVGNRILADESGRWENYVTCYVLRPDDLGEFPDIGAYLNAYNVRAVKLYPKTQMYGFDEFTCGKIFENLERREIPLLIEGGRSFVPSFNQTSIEELNRVCAAHPKLKVVLQGSRWDGMREVFFLMKKHSNLMLEFSSQQVNHGIEFFIENFGAGRLLFGTQFPMMSIGAARAFIDYSDISDSAKERVAGRNLAELLGVEIPECISDKGMDDRILVTVKAGKPLVEFNIIDAHAHIVPEGEHVAYSPILFSGANDMVKGDARLGIQRACVSDWLAIWLDHERGNEGTYDAVCRYPQHFVGYGAFDPNYVQDWEDELKLWFKQRRFQGIKPYYPRNEVPYNSEKWKELFSFGDLHRLFVLLHPSDHFVAEAEEVSHKYPGLRLLLAHSGMNFKHASEVCELAKLRENVYLELTFTDVPDGVIEFIVSQVGSEKVLFGTDQPMRDASPQFGWVAYSRISEEDKTRILGTNMNKILESTRLP
ncbi:MAG: amidohydrolase family protein [Ignavibacteriaceae bacterium]